MMAVPLNGYQTYKAAAERFQSICSGNSLQEVLTPVFNSVVGNVPRPRPSVEMIEEIFSKSVTQLDVAVRSAMAERRLRKPNEFLNIIEESKWSLAAGEAGYHDRLRTTVLALYHCATHLRSNPDDWLVFCREFADRFPRKKPTAQQKDNALRYVLPSALGDDLRAAQQKGSKWFKALEPCWNEHELPVTVEALLVEAGSIDRLRKVSERYYGERLAGELGVDVKIVGSMLVEAQEIARKNGSLVVTGKLNLQQGHLEITSLDLNQQS